MQNTDAVVSVDWVLDHLEDPAVRIVEIQHEPDIDEYADGHIPGAVRWFWKDCYWDELTREFVTPQQMASWLGAAGIGPDTTLVLYSMRNQFAAYGYWIYHVMNGHRDVRILDGGRRNWLASAAPTTAELPGYDPVSYPVPVARVRDDSTRIKRDELVQLLGRPGVVLLDGRYEEEYRGDRVKPGVGPDHGAERHGHIPGAVHLPFHELVRPDSFAFKDAAQLEALFRGAGAAPDQAEQVVAYCRLGHRGSLLWFAASQLLGWDHVRVYDGSWTEWGSSVGLPIARDVGSRVGA